MEKSPNNGIKLFGATLTPHHRETNDDGADHTQNADETKKPDKIIPCPRCKSMDTKFCYFNNYNVNQPRHFCKGCQRYWTAGGALRNVPIGAGRRKNRPVSWGRGVDEVGCELYDGNHNAVQRYFDLEGGEHKWFRLTEAETGFRQMIPAGKRQRIGDDVDRNNLRIEEDDKGHAYKVELL